MEGAQREAAWYPRAGAMRWLVIPFLLLALLMACDNTSGPNEPAKLTVAVTETGAAATDA